jgi:hypothetical protein
VSSDPIIRRNDRAAFRALTENEGGVLLHLDSGAYHGLNPIGTLIWNLIGEGAKLSDVVGAVRIKLTDPPADLQADIETFIHDLAERDLLTLE